MSKWLILLFLSFNVAAEDVAFKSQVMISGVVVSSVCSVIVSSGTSKRGIIDFGEYNKATHSGSGTYPFSLYLYEDGATDTGCDAFLAGKDFVDITFGGNGNQQLDARGVITSGAGDNIRIEVIPTDVSASTRAPITINNNVVSYDKNFAAKGIFNFNATPQGLNDAAVGQYSGRLSIIISYK